MPIPSFARKIQGQPGLSEFLDLTGPTEGSPDVVYTVPSAPDPMATRVELVARYEDGGGGEVRCVLLHGTQQVSNFEHLALLESMSLVPPVSFAPFLTLQAGETLTIQRPVGSTALNANVVFVRIWEEMETAT